MLHQQQETLLTWGGGGFLVPCVIHSLKEYGHLLMTRPLITS